MCTLKLLKALCSVLVTTKIESPVKIKDTSVPLRFLKCPGIKSPHLRLPHCNPKKHDTLRLERMSTFQTHSGVKPG